MQNGDKALWLVRLALLAAFGRWVLVDAPAALRLVRFEHAHLSGLSTEARRVEMYFPPPDRPERRQNYIGMRRYFEFLADIQARTPQDARVGLVGLPMESLYKFAHYHLYPRHPFPIDGRDPSRAADALKLDWIATFDMRGGRVDRARR